jgi:hypothetical protein
MTELIAFLAGFAACALYYAIRCRMADRKQIEQEDEPWGV